MAPKDFSLNYLLASHVWQQDHNGFTHQDPGFLDHVIKQESRFVRACIIHPTPIALSVLITPAHDIGFLVDDVIEEARILVREAIVILLPERAKPADSSAKKSFGPWQFQIPSAFASG